MVQHGETLVVIPSLEARRARGGGVVLTEKFVEGMRRYRELWPGPIRAIMGETEVATSNLDEVEYDPASLPFELLMTSPANPGLGRLLKGSRIVLGCTDYLQNDLAATCRAVGVPCVYVAENSLKTRMQLMRAERAGALRSLRRGWWQLGQEQCQRRAVREAAGVQCNGTPTFEAYAPINDRPLLFFDSRVRKEALVPEAVLSRRHQSLLRGAPLRLLFSGRLAAIKGGDHLIRVADHLRRLGVSFELTICGDGALAPAMKSEAARLGLGGCVKFAGVLDYQAELVPLTAERADLFVCCHRSGDPSCTYLEVMACGTPIVGYANEAFAGLSRTSDVGWTTPQDSPREMARKIAELDRDRGSLVAASRMSLEFASRHTFEATVASRIEHLQACSPRSKAEASTFAFPGGAAIHPMLDAPGLLQQLAVPGGVDASHA